MIAAAEGRPAQILLVEDDAGLAAMVCDTLRARGHTVWHVDRGADAEAAVVQLRPDIVVLDLILPDGNGLLVCAALKARTGIPIIICSATKRHDDAVIGLHLGADDFLRKPFSVDELQARIKLVLQRSARRVDGSPDRLGGSQRVGRLVIDNARCQAIVNGGALSLTPIEYRLLSTLADRSGEVLSRKALAEQVWEYVDEGVLRSLDVHMRRVRAKLASAAGSSPTLVTRRGFGYQLLDKDESAAAT